MDSKENQIKSILMGTTFDWARQQLLSGQSMDDYKFSDFVSVTPEDIKHFVDVNGFPGTNVYEEGSSQARWGDDQYCIVQTGGQWEVFYLERGNKSDFAYFATLEEARGEVISRLIGTAKILLNHRFRFAHPHLDLPPPSEM